MRASTSPKTVTRDDITPEAKKRNEEAARAFDEKRDFAEFEAAKSRWQQNDRPGCQEALQRLLARNPRHHEARVFLAEVLLSEGDPQAAYAQAKAALDLAPNDPQVQHAMGLALDGLGRSSEALAYYERATKMEPLSELFAGAYQAASEAARADARNGPNSVVNIHGAGDDTPDDLIPVGYTAPLVASRGPACADRFVVLCQICRLCRHCRD